MLTKEILRLDKLSCRKNRISDTASGISLSVCAGEYKTITSETGADSADLLPLITGEMKMISGSGSLLGYPLQKRSSSRRRQLLQQIGILSRIDPLVSGVTLNEFLTLPLKIAGVSSGHLNSRVRTILTNLGLLVHMHQQMSSLSPAQLRMAALAQALIKSPRLIIAELRSDQFDDQVVVPILHKQATHGTAVLVIIDTKTSPRHTETSNYHESEYNVAF